MAAPDHARGLLDRLKLGSEIVALVSDRFMLWTPGLPFPSSWNMPRAAVVVVRGGGDRPERYLDRPRFDLRCFGATISEADALWRAVDAWLMPPIGSAQYVGRGAPAYSVSLEGGPNWRADDASQWPYVTATIRVLAAAKVA